MQTKEIQTIATTSMTDGNNLTFHRQSYDFFSRDEAVAEELTTQLTEYLRLIEVEDNVMKKITFSEITADITRADNDRDILFNMFMRVAKAYLGFSVESYKKAAERIERYAKVNKVNPASQYDRETGDMANFIQDMREYCAAEVELLGLTPVLNDMDEKNQLVNSLLMERNEEYVDTKHISVLQARTNTDSQYNFIRKLINAKALLQGEARYSRVIDLQNQNIERLKLQLFGKRGQAGVNGGATPEGGEGEGGEGGSEEEKKYRDLIFVVGEEEVERIRCEVGKAIPESDIPEAPEGMEWERIPEVMPDEDVVVTAVPEENEDENEDFTPGMDWPSDVPAPEGWTKVIFRDKDGRETVKLYRNGSSVYSQGGYPENAPGYEWIGIHAILNGNTHTITEYEE